MQVAPQRRTCSNTKEDGTRCEDDASRDCIDRRCKACCSKKECPNAKHAAKFALANVAR